MTKDPFCVRIRFFFLKRWNGVNNPPKAPVESLGRRLGVLWILGLIVVSEFEIVFRVEIRMRWLLRICSLDW